MERCPSPWDPAPGREALLANQLLKRMRAGGSNGNSSHNTKTESGGQGKRERDCTLAAEGESHALSYRLGIIPHAAHDNARCFVHPVLLLQHFLSLGFLHAAQQVFVVHAPEPAIAASGFGMEINHALACDATRTRSVWQRSLPPLNPHRRIPPRH